MNNDFNAYKSKVLDSILSTHDIQKIVLENYDLSFHILKFIYVCGCVTSCRLLKELYGAYEYSYYVGILFHSKLIKIVDDSFVVLENRAIQIIENKLAMEDASYSFDVKKLKTNDTANKVINKAVELSVVLAKVDLDKREAIDNMIYSCPVNNFIRVTTVQGKTFPHSSTFNCHYNSGSKVLLNSNIFQISNNVFFLYVSATTNKCVVRDLERSSSFIKNNFINPVLYTNIASQSLIEKSIDIVGIDIKSVYAVDRIITLDFNQLATKLKDEITSEYKHLKKKGRINGLKLDITNPITNKAVVFTETTTTKSYIGRVEIYYYSLKNVENLDTVKNEVLYFLNS